MSFNGSGTFVINSAGQPVVANTVISATVFNALTSDLATGLSTCITKDGQTTVTANIPFGSNKITGLGAGTVATDAANLGQVQSTAAKLITVTGTDTITGTMSPVLTAYAAGQLFYFISNGTNTGAMTINIDGLGAKAITRDGSTALIAGDVVSGEIVVICYDGTRFQMINAANSFGNTTINGTLTVTGDTALQANVSVTSALTVNGTFGVTGAATLGSTLSVAGKSDLPTVSTASMNAAVAVVTTGTVTNLTSTSASIASMNAGVALLTTATVTTLTASGASIASANIGNLQFTAASIASINAGVAVITNLTATSASIASMNAGVALLTTATVTNLTATGASIASANAGNLQVTGASVASANVGVALITTGTVTTLTSTQASIGSANVGTAVVTGLTVTNASIASANAATATLSGNLTLSGGTANGVLYLDGSKVATSGSALTFNGTTQFTYTSSSDASFDIVASGAGTAGYLGLTNAGTDTQAIGFKNGLRFGTATGTGGAGFSELMRLTSTGLGIGTSSPTEKLHVAGALRVTGTQTTAGTGVYLDQTSGTGGVSVYGPDNSTQGTFRIYTATANGGTGSTKLTIDSSGNLGLGVTPSAWSAFKAVQIGTGSLASTPTGHNVSVAANAYFDGSNWKYVDTAAATEYRQNGGAHFWSLAPSGTAGNNITFTQAMTLDASGQLALGRTSVTDLGANIRTVDMDGTSGAGFRLRANGTNILNLYAASSAVYMAAPANVPIVFETNNTERARITAGGDLLVNTTTAAGKLTVLQATNGSYAGALQHSNTSPYGLQVNYTNATPPNNTTNRFIDCEDTGGFRFQVRSNGGIANYQSNNVDLSDVRTKKDIAPAASMWDKIGALEIVTYKYNDQTHDDVNVGVIAQQVESVEPVWVDNDGFGKTPEGEEPLKTVYTKDIYFAAIKALQEAMARIEKLEAEMAALKGA